MLVLSLWVPGVTFLEFFAAAQSNGSDAPVYRRLQAALVDAIASGTLKPGAVLPPERELALELGISRVTVRRAMAELVRQGLIIQRHGSGTYVSGTRERVVQSLSRLYSFSEDMTSRGRSPGTLWLERDLSVANADEARRLEMPNGGSVVRMCRLRLADKEPIALETSLIPAAILPDPKQIEDSLYRTLRDLGHVPVKAVQRFSAINLDEKSARLLNAPTGAAALDIYRITRREDGVVVESSRSIFRGDAYDFVAELGLGR
ncbi:MULTISPECIES: GntR family transcriptional regulator [unclassified Mesorhizobium]|uniref:GntR family transcriptional regulator n=1 Tax=unclassified Mesorhizobium TaxID=325217 RepID=UPI000FD1D79A|nr:MULTISPECIES: GntR family transcriptional regulator [unclassified Mesorhizobium]RVB72901.1 GntR family transcriptional regulator [Mesorhizobium sp. M6A.T.Cr.TU.014.01.1.1]RWP49805.1 MAG: GntR family transcriptional regulator [Mesorhizobium sp.]RWP99839.1 MAG: GntR family transcriptional regulator [Mesorhizobium sp.]RWQ01435.1 MAG: GntR family transcriptional regulator [Mesorhizobium sp.]RWQ65867.1 MAG: GntR family transcriptional regulator [Mesorhizobium sp.]